METIQKLIERKTESVQQILSRLASLHNVSAKQFSSPMNISLEDKLKLISVENERLKQLLTFVYQKLKSPEFSFGAEFLSSFVAMETALRQKQQEIEALKQRYQRSEEAM